MEVRENRTTPLPRLAQQHCKVFHRTSPHPLFGRILLMAWALAQTRSQACALTKQNDLHHLAHQTWRTENGLPQNTVHAILQTRDGYVWLATEGGVVRFDGVRFAIYDRQNTPELKSNNIRALAEDREGALWIASADGLVRWKGPAHTAFTTKDGLPSGNIWSLYVDRAGTLWAATTEGLARLENNRFSAVPNTSNVTGAMAQDRDGHLWLATQDGLKILQNGNLRNAFEHPLLAKGSAEALLIDSADRVWIGTAAGLLMQSGATSRLYTTQDGLPSNRITALYQDTEGSVWIGTDTGAGRIANGKVDRFPPGAALAGEMILSIYEDREGNLWSGTEAGGVTVLRQQKFTTYTDAEHAAGDPVRCVFEDRNGVVWLGTGGHGLRRYDLRRFPSGRFSTLTTREGLASDQVFALAEHTDGSLLVGTPDGLNRIRNGLVSVLTSADGLADDFVRSIFRDADGSLWIGTRRGLSHAEHGRFRTYTQADGLGSDLVGALWRDHANNLWIGTLNGLTRRAGDAFRNFTTADGLSSNVITTLHEDNQGILWIGTEDGGLNRYSNGRFTHYSSAVGLPQTIYGIAEDAQEHLWMSSNTGIFRANKRELNNIAAGHAGPAAVISYGAGDGLTISECSGGGHPAIWKSRDGSLWFPTPRGVAVLRAEEAGINLVPPPVTIESVSVDDRSFDPALLTDVGPGHSRFSFEYAGLSFIAPQKVRFKYKLEGFDKDWTDAGTRRVAYYTNISPGNYRFRVLARNNDGIWNESGAALPFRLLPRFYQTYWFAAVMLAALGLIGYGTYRWRVSEVEARFNAVLEERNRIAREIHDTLAQGFVAVSVQLEIVARLLTSSAASAKDHLDEARSMVRESLSEARSAIWELRSHSAASEDLAARLSKMALRTTASSAAKVRCEVHGTYRPLPRDVEDQLVRIAQEAVTNAVRHASAANIGIELLFDPKSVRMTIADDGRGFAMLAGGNGPDGHFGLRGMRERAGQIKAELTVTSAAGEGTSVSVEATIS